MANTPNVNHNSDTSREPFLEITPPNPCDSKSPPRASALPNPPALTPTAPTPGEQQDVTSPVTHYVLPHPASPSTVATSDLTLAADLPASSHDTASIVFNEGLRTNGVAAEEQFQDQDQNEIPATENRKSNVEEVVKTLEQKIETIMGKLQTKDMEIELLNEEVKVAYSKIGDLYQRISDLEKSVNNMRHSTANPNTTPSREERSLLLGDANLQRAAPSDLENCSIRTIKGANIDLMKCWVSEKMTWSPSSCFIYAGLSDLQNNLDPVSILDQMTDLVGELKLKNNNMNIFISQLAPTIISEEFQARIADFNEHLNNWGECNEISILQTDLTFKLGTGEVDDMCYTLDKDSSTCVLNRYGVVRLFSAFRKQCPSFKVSRNWDSIKKNVGVLPDKYMNKNDNVNRGRHTAPRTPNTRHVLPSPSPAPAPAPAPAPTPAPAPAPTPAPTPTPLSTLAPTTYAQAAASHFPERPHIILNTARQWGAVRSAPNSIPQRNTRTTTLRGNGAGRHGPVRGAGDGSGGGDGIYHQGRHDSHYNTGPNMHRYHNTHAHTRGRRGCYNCGEENHHQASCKFDHRLQCHCCNKLGHKQRMCTSYNY